MSRRTLSPAAAVARPLPLFDRLVSSQAALLACMSLALLCLCLLLSTPVSAQQQSDHFAPEAASERQDKVKQQAERFMVAAAHPAATRVGYEVLKEGGNAIDAMVAVQTLLGLVEPQSSGLGGGAFLVYYDAASQSLTTFDGRETAPITADKRLFLNFDGEPMQFYDAVVGGRSVATPGTVRLLRDVHSRYGRQPWSTLLKPAEELARSGFPISPRLAELIAADAERLGRFPETAAYFLNEDGTPKAEGTVLRNEPYAETLRHLRFEGAEGFYRGELAAAIVKRVLHASGKLGLTDLADYEIKEREPVCAPYREYQVCGMGPPSSGALTVGQALMMLEPFALSTYSPDDAEAWQLIGDASRLAFADRGRYMADSDFVDMPEGLLDRDYMARRSALIEPGKMLAVAEPGQPPGAEDWQQGESLELPSTSHFVIVDGDGNVVSMTSTIENAFGSRLMVGGFLLNNELTDFSFVPEKDGKPVANRVEGGKRPRSSMSPTIVMKDGRPYLALGSPGGSRIIGYVLKNLVAHLDWNLDVQQAIALPNAVNRFGSYDLEAGTEAEQLVTPLRELGYEVEVRELNSGVHSVLIGDGYLEGGADPRREGRVMGD